MLRRLFPSPDTIASYSPDAQNRVRRRSESTNYREEVCPKTAKISLIDVSVEYSIGEIVWCCRFQECNRSLSGKNPIPTCDLDAERRS